MGAVARIAVIPGDGIGPEVTREARGLLEALARSGPVDLQVIPWELLGAERYLRDGVTITDEEFRALAEEHDVILLGALGDPRVPDGRHARDILLGLRFKLDLYVNYRPNRLPSPAVSPLRDLGGREPFVEIFRENTEGAYAGLGESCGREARRKWRSRKRSTPATEWSA